MKALAWFSLSVVILGLLIGAGPYLLLKIIGEDSPDSAALGWIFIFFSLPVGLLLLFIALILILIAGIRGLAKGSPRRFGVLALVGACGTALSALVVIALEFNNLLTDFDAPTTSLIPNMLITVALLIVGLVGTFFIGFQFTNTVHRQRKLTCW